MWYTLWYMKNPWIIIGLVTVVLFGGAIWYSSSVNEKNNEGVEIITHVKGNPDAAVTLVEYSDLQCPACASYYPVVKEVVEQYEDDIRFEYKHFPLPIHPYALQAGVAAEAAGQQGKFFEFHDMLFENQSAWSNSPTPNALFAQYAEELELDMDMFRRHTNSTLLRDKVRDEMAEGRALGVNSTPTFFLNGEQMNPQEFQTLAGFAEQVITAVDPAATASSTEEAAGGASGVRFGI